MEKRDKIIITENGVTTTGKNIWMSAMEIAELLNVGGGQVNNAIRKLLKSDVLRNYEVCKCIRLDEKRSVDVYNMEVIIPLAFQWDTHHTDIFKKWLIRKTLSTPKDTQPIILRYKEGYIC